MKKKTLDKILMEILRSADPYGACQIAEPVRLTRKIARAVRRWELSEIRRILRSDGTFFLNIGDCYAGSGGGHRDGGGQNGLGAKDRGNRVGIVGRKPSYRRDRRPREDDSHKSAAGIKPKDLFGIPWTLALALRSDGWWLRSEVIWDKGNPMPESTEDRPTKSHEQIFLLTKSLRYFYDREAIKEPSESGLSDIKKMIEQKDRISGKHLSESDPFLKASSATHIGQKRAVGFPGYRNKRTVWHMNTCPYPGAHFATFPEELPATCILAGTSEKGACVKCGSPWERQIEREAFNHKSRNYSQDASGGVLSGGVGKNLPDVITKTIGWEPTCRCRGRGTRPCIVLDPFMGAGTTALVALKHNRQFLGIELNPEYVKMSEKRIEAERRQLKLF